MTDQTSVAIDLGDRSYSIRIGCGIIDRPVLFEPALSSGAILVVTNDIVGELYLEPVLRSLSGYAVDSLVLPDGEIHKTLATTERVYDKLMADGFGRDCTLIALGGGVIGDLVGFAAATYQRGVAFIQIPTTLLAQVDSSVGGKTGVNHARGKNMIGAFHQPRLVLADTDTLHTLPDRELSAGLAEVIKYGMLGDGEFFDWLEANIDALRGRDGEALTHAIARSCENKAAIVAADEKEAGQRALLNLGHTFGHAIEAGLGYGEWLHGEAVAAGMCLAADLSVRLGWLDAGERDRCVDLIAAAGLPIGLPPRLTKGGMLELMARDKKVLAGELRLVLMRGIGQAVLTTDFDEASLHATLDSYLEAAPAAPRASA